MDKQAETKPAPVWCGLGHQPQMAQGVPQPRGTVIISGGVVRPESV